MRGGTVYRHTGRRSAGACLPLTLLLGAQPGCGLIGRVYLGLWFLGTHVSAGPCGQATEEDWTAAAREACQKVDRRAVAHTVACEVVS